jgi:hypothetical protein
MLGWKNRNKCGTLIGLPTWSGCQASLPGGNPDARNADHDPQHELDRAVSASGGLSAARQRHEPRPPAKRVDQPAGCLDLPGEGLCPNRARAATAQARPADLPEARTRRHGPCRQQPSRWRCDRGRGLSFQLIGPRAFVRASPPAPPTSPCRSDRVFVRTGPRRRPAGYLSERSPAGARRWHLPEQAGTGPRGGIVQTRPSDARRRSKPGERP